MRGDEPRSRGGVPLGTDTSTMEEYFKIVFGESPEEVVDRERRGEIKRKSENRTEEEWEQMAKRLKEGSERRAVEASVPGQGLDADMAEVLDERRKGSVERIRGRAVLRRDIRRVDGQRADSGSKAS